MKTKYALLLVQGNVGDYMHLCSITGETTSMSTAFTESKQEIINLKEEMEKLTGLDYKILTITEIE